MAKCWKSVSKAWKVWESVLKVEKIWESGLKIGENVLKVE